MNFSLFNHLGIGFIAIGGMLGSATGSTWIAGTSSIIGFVFLLITSVRRELFLWLIIILALILFLKNGSYTNVKQAFVAGAEFGTLMIAISFVGLAVNASYVKKPFQRYLESTTGQRGRIKAYATGHAAGALLNLSGLVILSSAVEKSDQNNTITVPNHLASLHHGFAFAPTWSPYSYFTPIVLSTLPGISWSDMLKVALVFTIPLFIISMSTVGTDKHIHETQEMKSLSHRERNSLFFAFLFCMSFTLCMNLTSISPRVLIHWLLPVLALIWAAMEATNRSSYMTSLIDHVLNRIPTMRFEILALSAAGFMSAGAAQLYLLELIDYISVISSYVSPQGMSYSPMALMLFLLIVGFMMLGVNPVLFVALVAAGIDLEYYSLTTGIAILIGSWGLFPSLSQFAAANIVVARAAGISAAQMTFEINRNYNVIALVVCSLIVLSIDKIIH